jgi:hypothetical protein
MHQIKETGSGAAASDTMPLTRLTEPSPPSIAARLTSHQEKGERGGAVASDPSSPTQTTDLFPPSTAVVLLLHQDEEKGGVMMVNDKVLLKKVSEETFMDGIAPEHKNRAAAALGHRTSGLDFTYSVMVKVPKTALAVPERLTREMNVLYSSIDITAKEEMQARLIRFDRTSAFFRLVLPSQEQFFKAISKNMVLPVAETRMLISASDRSVVGASNPGNRDQLALVQQALKEGRKYADYDKAFAAEQQQKLAKRQEATQVILGTDFLHFWDACSRGSGPLMFPACHPASMMCHSSGIQIQDPDTAPSRILHQALLSKCQPANCLLYCFGTQGECGRLAMQHTTGPPQLVSAVPPLPLPAVHRETAVTPLPHGHQQRQRPSCRCLPRRVLVLPPTSNASACRLHCCRGFLYHHHHYTCFRPGSLRI